MSLPDVPVLLDRLAQRDAGPEDRETLRALTETFPGYVTAHVALARTCEQEGSWDEARRSWKRAHLLLPTSPAVREGLRRTAAPREEHSGQEHSGEPASDDAPRAEAFDEASSETSRPLEPGEAPVQVPSSDREAHLDTLIEELEGARIEPSPNPDDDVPAPELDADGDVVSPTLARIYEAQGQLEEAARACTAGSPRSTPTRPRRTAAGPRPSTPAPPRKRRARESEAAREQERSSPAHGRRSPRGLSRAPVRPRLHAHKCNVSSSFSKRARASSAA